MVPKVTGDFAINIDQEDCCPQLMERGKYFLDRKNCVLLQSGVILPKVQYFKKVFTY